MPKRVDWPKWCWGPRATQHIKGCHPKRPKCGYRRKFYTKKYGPPCECGVYHFPHRKGSGLCGNPRREFEWLNQVSWDDGSPLSTEEVRERSSYMARKQR